MAIRWTTAFWDFPARGFEQGIDFWLEATGSTLSPRRGPDGAFATLRPAAGDAYLRVQRAVSGSGNHLDLHVDDLDAETERAVALGAATEHTEPGLAVLRSPGGLAFCLVSYGGESRLPVAGEWPGGHTSVVDQLCVDIPPGRYAREREFWAGLTARAVVACESAEFERLARPADQPLEILLQRLDADAAGPVRAHLDLACSDVDAETVRHIRMGAEPIRRTAHWQTFRDPAGLEYCVTNRAPSAP